MRRRFALVTAGLAAAILVAGCDSGYHYVKSSADKTYFKVPSDWTLFDEEEVVEFDGTDLTESQRDEVLDSSWRVAFDAAPKPSMGHVEKVLTNHPVGRAFVGTLSFEEADAMSNQTLRNLFFDVDTAREDGSAEILDYEEVQLDGGFRGVHMVTRIADTRGRSAVIDHTALVDQATSKIYAMYVGCSSDCYDANLSKIESIVDSWTVRDQ